MSIERLFTDHEKKLTIAVGEKFDYSIDNCNRRIARILRIARFDKKFEIN